MGGLLPAWIRSECLSFFTPLPQLCLFVPACVILSRYFPKAHFPLISSNLPTFLMSQRLTNSTLWFATLTYVLNRYDKLPGFLLILPGFHYLAPNV